MFKTLSDWIETVTTTLLILIIIFSHEINILHQRNTVFVLLLMLLYLVYI